MFLYADEIFSLGRELLDMVRARPTDRPMKLIVGVVDVMPKYVAHRLIEPALRRAKASSRYRRSSKSTSLGKHPAVVAICETARRELYGHS